MQDNMVRILVNVTYSYSIVATAAKSVQDTPKWAGDQNVSKLVFSNKWAGIFLKRGGVSRRKITRGDKDVPDVEEINRILKIGRDMYINNGHEPSTCYNFDETAFTYSIGPSRVFCPGDQQRATNIGISNTKRRITAVIAVNAVGAFAPLMLIIKHSISSEARPDQTGMKVISDLFKKEGFTAKDGWEKIIWEKKFTIKGITAVHKCTYLKHTITVHVITSQVKAWNDTTRMVMWFDLIMKPIKDRLGKLLIWCDNCGSHKTSSVKEVIAETNIDVAFLPPNMTAELQVLDLVVNGPIKAHVKNKRARRLYDRFQDYKIERLADMKLPRNQRRNPEFKPPKPTMLEGMKDLILLFQEQFTEEKFKKCVNTTFINTGTLPVVSVNDNLPSPFLPYSKVASCGTLSVVPLGTMDYECVEEISAEREEEAFERALFLHFVTNIDRSEEVDEDEGTESEGEN